jgi:hypothetical protein
MNPIEFQALRGQPAPAFAVVTGKDLRNQTPRTLVWGYTHERESFHVYLDEAGVIRRVVYSGLASVPETLKLLSADSENTLQTNAQYAPSKRAYPEACDFEFCALLAGRDVKPSFTAYDDKRDLSKAFHGLCLDEVPGQRVALVEAR